MKNQYQLSQSDFTTMIQGYCAYCRETKPMQGATQISNRRGGIDLKGSCGNCGKAMYRLGGWDAPASETNDSLAATRPS